MIEIKADLKKINFFSFVGGCVKPNAKLRISHPSFPNNESLVVSAIQHNKVNMTEAKPFDFIGISFTSASLGLIQNRGDFHVVKRTKFGMMIADAEHMPKRVKSFVAAIAIVSRKKVYLIIDLNLRILSSLILRCKFYLLIKKAFHNLK